MAIDASRNSTRALICAVAYWALALLVIAAGVSRRASIPQVPLMDKDSVGYLNPALSLYSGGPMLLEHGRNYPYPGLIYLGLRIFNDFRALAILQHLSGILAGILAILAWNQARALIANPAMPELVYRLIGLIPALVFFVTTKNTYYELYLRPEAVLPFFVMSSIFLAVEFLRARFVEGGLRKGLVYGALLVINAGLIFLIKPSWGLNVLFGMAPVLASVGISQGAEKQPGWIARAMPLVAGGFILLVAFFIPDHALKKRDPMGNLFLPETLFTIHADLILAQLEQDSAHNETPYPAELIRDTAAQLRSELQGRAKHKMGTLAFDADYLLYLSPLFPDLTLRLGGDRQKLASFCFYYYKRAFLKQPKAMRRKITASLKAFYQAECPLYEAEKKGPALSGNYSASVKLLRPLPSRSEPLERYQSLCAELAKEKPALKPSWLGRGLYEALRRSYLPSLFLAVALALGVFVRPKLRADLGLFTAVVLLPFAYNFGTSFTVSVIHTLGIRRYIFSQQSFALLAQFLALALLMEMLARLIRRFAPPAGGLCEAAEGKQTAWHEDPSA